LDKKSTFIK